MTDTSISLTITAAFGVGLWLILPPSFKALAELFQLLLILRITFLMGRISALDYFINNINELPKHIKEWLDEE
jgi:hypothetical protein